MIVKKTVLSLIFICSLSSVVYPENADFPDKFLSELYLKHSFQEYNKNNFNDAYRLADISQEFFSGNSDTFFIKAVSSYRLHSPDFSMDDLYRAVILNKWTYFEETDARYYLSEIMYRRGDPESAYINLKPFRSEIEKNGEYLGLFLRLSASVKEKEEALEAASNYTKLNPGNSAVQLFLAGNDPEWRKWASEILLSGDEAGLITKEAAEVIISEAGNCGSMLDFYLKKWGETRFYFISRLCKSGYNEAAIKDLYYNGLTVDFNEIMRVSGFLHNEDEKSKFLKYLSGLEIKAVYDLNSDGYMDTTAEFRKGNLISIEWDHDQDTVFDHLIELDSKPVKFSGVDGDNEFVVIYEPYPFIQSMEILDARKSEFFRIIPYSLELDVISVPSDPLVDIPHIYEQFSLPEKDLLGMYSSERKIVFKDSKEVIETFRINSDTAEEEIYNSKGTRVVEKHIKNNILVDVFRDYDEDGNYDANFIYVNGELSELRYDANSNGVTEYMEKYNGTVEKFWDFNEDGVFDSVEREEEGRTIRKMSSEMNGVFDIHVEIDSEGNDLLPENE